MNDIIGEDYEIDDVMIEQLDLYDQSIAERTVEEVIDVDSGEILQADDIFSQDESVIISIRKALELAHKSDIYKYICPYCQQEVRISHKRVFSRNSTTYFFSHYPNSNDCPIKSENTKTLAEILEDRVRSKKECKLHKELVSFISQKLESDVSKSKGFFDVKKYAIFKDNNISNEWRKPDITVMLGSKKVVFELQLLHTFLGDMTERDSFYRLHNTHIIWIFKSFSPQNQKMVEKDLYHAHKRNVFVLDQEAYYKEKDKPFNKDSYVYSQVESDRRNELILRCYWQKPVIDDKKKVKIEWHHKLVSIDELTFDEETKQVYYYNSDKDFYQQIDSEKQELIDLWEAEKEKRWKKIFDSFKQRQERKRDWQDKKEEREAKYAEKLKYIQLLSKIKNGEIELKPYSNAERLWGFVATDNELFDKPVVIIKAKYSEVKPFQNGIAFVRQANWGAVNIVGKKVISFQYTLLSWIDGFELIIARDKYSKYGIISTNDLTLVSFIYEKMNPFIDGKSISKKNNKWGQIDINGNDVIPFEYVDIKGFVDGKAYAEKKGKWGCIDETGNELIPFIFNRIERFENGIAKAMKNFRWGIIDENGKEVIPFDYEEIESFDKGIAKAKKNDHYGFIDIDGNQIIQNKTNIGLDLYKGEKFGLWAIFDSDDNIVTPFVYSEVDIFENRIVKVKKNGYYGYIDENGIEVISCIYELIDHFKNGIAKAFKNRNCGCIDEKGNDVIPFIYREIESFENGIAKAYKSRYSGFIDEKGKEIIPFVYEEIGNFENGIAKAKKNVNYGYIDKNGNTIIQNKTDIGLGLYKGEKFGNWGVIDSNDNIVAPFVYSEIENYVNNIVKAKKNRFWGYIDEKGNEVVHNKTAVGLNMYKGEIFGKWGLIDYCDSKITSFEYDEIVKMNGCFICFRNNSFNLTKSDKLVAEKITCKINGVSDFGLFLEISGVKGLLHINEIRRAGVQISTFSKGDSLDVFVSDADEKKNRLSFSILPNNQVSTAKHYEEKKVAINSIHVGVISRIENYGLFVRIKGIGTAMLHISELKKHGKNIFDYKINDEIEVKILNVDREKNRVSLTL